MNEKFHNSIKKAGEEISLTNDERARMRRTLHSYMEMKPLRTLASTPVPTFGWFFRFRPVAAVLVLTLFVSSGGVSYAAENALPGDILYPIKTHVNESVKGVLAVSASAKTAWAMNVAGERVKEAATLAAEGRLRATTRQELQADFEQHAQQATAQITRDANSTPDANSETAVRFEAQLSEYENVLARIGTAKNVDIASLTSSVKKEREHIAAVRTRTESHIASTDTDNSATVRMGIAARAQFDVSEKLARAVSKSLSSSSAQFVAAQLDDASNSISAGDDFAAKSAGPDALGAFRKALTATEKLGVFLQTSSDIHARTGLIVGEPHKSKRSGNNEEGVSSQHIQTGAGINAAATSSSITTPVETY